MWGRRRTWRSDSTIAANNLRSLAINGLTSMHSCQSICPCLLMLYAVKSPLSMILHWWWALLLRRYLGHFKIEASVQMQLYSSTMNVTDRTQRMSRTWGGYKHQVAGTPSTCYDYARPVEA